MENFKETKTYTISYFDIDNFVFCYQGFTDGREWNGWAIPFLTKEVIKAYIENDNDTDFYTIKYDGVKDEFITTNMYDVEEYKNNENFDINDYIEISKGFDISYDGKIYHVYDFSNNWIWNSLTLQEAKQFYDENIICINE